MQGGVQKQMHLLSVNTAGRNNLLTVDFEYRPEHLSYFQRKTNLRRTTCCLTVTVLLELSNFIRLSP